MAYAKITQVIEVRSTVGKGVEGDPIRQIVEYFDMEGTRLAFCDPAPHSREEAPRTKYEPNQGTAR